MSSRGIGYRYLGVNQRFYTTAEGKKMLEELKEGKGDFKPFGQQIDVYIFALTIGIITRDLIEAKFDQMICVLETYRNHDPYGVFPLVVKSMYPGASESEVGQFMHRFAEAGLRTIHKEFKGTGKIDFERWIKISRGIEEPRTSSKT
jgi:hypothetical protein